MYMYHHMCVTRERAREKERKRSKNNSFVFCLRKSYLPIMMTEMNCENDATAEVFRLIVYYTYEEMSLL